MPAPSFHVLSSSALLLAVALAAPAAGQLDIPKGDGRPATGGQSGQSAPDAPSTPNAPSTPSTSGAGNGSQRGLGLKPKGDGEATDATEPERPRGLDIGVGLRGHQDQPAPKQALPQAEQPTPAVPAGAVLDTLRTIDQASDPRLASAVTSLLAAGEAGLSAARAALHADGVGPVLAGAEVLLSAGSEADVDRVAARLSGRLPTSAVAPLLELLKHKAPVKASPRLFAELLDHPQAVMRHAAARHFAELASAEDLPLLVARLSSDRSDTRLQALELIAGLDDPAALNVLFDRLDDPAAKVAWGAAQLLGRSTAEEIAPRLCAAAFPDQHTPDRRASYARLALAEYEDRNARALAGDEHVERLLADLAAEDPLRRGAAAVILAGVGFRGTDSRGYAWLDRDVPHELVRQVSGERFHRDFGSLAEPSARRLALLSGCSFGADGEAWRRWWVDAAESFRSHRAVIAIAADETDRVDVAYQSGPPLHRALRFVGPAAAVDPSEPVLGETIFLTSDSAADVVARLGEEGVLGAERLPSVRDAAAGAARELEVRAGDQSKHFVLPAASRGEVDAWFDRLAHTLESLAERNRWQRYAPMGVDARAFWAQEHAWWSAEHTDAERDARMKELVLASFEGRHAFERGPGLAELEALAQRGALDAADFPRLVALLDGERYYGERVTEIAKLARAAARSGGATGVPRELIETLATNFGADAARDIVEALAEADPALVREAAHDPRPLVRALAAGALARRGDAESLAALRELLKDPEEDVEAAAVLAYAENGLHDADVELLLRARIAGPRVRAAALRAVGALAPDGALDALVGALAERDPALDVAAAEGIADLEDPAAAELLISLLARGSGSPVYEPARLGLRALGEEAFEPLLRVAQSSSASVRRDAALLLSEGGSADAAPILILILEASPRDERVKSELAVLTAIDFGDRSDASAAWRSWWATVVHDDALAWFRAACERLGLRTPPAEELEAGGSQRARLFLAEVLARDEGYLVERARRELSRMLGADVGALPARGDLRDAWLFELRERLTEPAPARGG